ncbi:uncharacterized protein LACBIDRAFT_333092 [Laccaria bicolor S238N-H82]|uniref:Predicted protein n=1 Tax=Laccaria bicolor (strain S238N-H82 / ATCC MYA-4686) TaxID=486041 RepID=B0DUU5_LACBS|nr:uncharacterized protein LACBIDRAFT_333092 [Laccaria bicolor S238N-H82]EDR01672.1 predicted protein [Laccaria bicolor S238N-H82]|eukprot:XP_001887748.1 predicted protein [Laccaria bicolor S238N-H82]
MVDLGVQILTSSTPFESPAINLRELLEGHSADPLDGNVYVLQDEGKSRSTAEEHWYSSTHLTTRKACNRQRWGAVCHNETCYTKEAFSDTPKHLLSETSRCQFAHSSKDFKHEAHSDLIYCVAFDTSSVDGSHALSSSRLFSSTDFFDKDRKVEELGIGKNTKGAIAFAIVPKYAVVALKDFFVESLKDTNRNDMGYVDYEKLYGVDGVGLANVVSNAKDVEGRGARKQLTMITFDDGSTWTSLRPPPRDSEGKRISCDPADTDLCSLHLHSVTTPHNYGHIFSSPAPGFSMGVGSIGESLLPYDESDTCISTDAGVTWQMVRRDAHKYEFGDKGSILVIVNDEDGTDNAERRHRHQILSEGAHDPPRLDLTNVPAARASSAERPDKGDWTCRHHPTRLFRDEETQQWYKRRKPDSDCYVGEKYMDPMKHEGNCQCTEEDYECDYNFVRNGKDCVPVGPEPIPAGTYKGSLGWRKIPGNTCVDGVKKDEKVDKKCLQAQPAPGGITHQIHDFKHQMVQHAYFKNPKVKTILVRLMDHTMWQFSNEGYNWTQIYPEHRFLAFYHHNYSDDRAYLITDTDTFYPTDTGRTGCSAQAQSCHAEAQCSRDNGRKWSLIDSYMWNCAWAKDGELNTDPNEIICKSYRDKKGNQRLFQNENPMELVTGSKMGRLEEQPNQPTNMISHASTKWLIITFAIQVPRPRFYIQWDADEAGTHEEDDVIRDEALSSPKLFRRITRSCTFASFNLVDGLFTQLHTLFQLRSQPSTRLQSALLK